MAFIWAMVRIELADFGGEIFMTQIAPKLVIRTGWSPVVPQEKFLKKQLHAIPFELYNSGVIYDPAE